MADREVGVRGTHGGPHMQEPLRWRGTPVCIILQTNRENWDLKGVGARMWFPIKSVLSMTNSSFFTSMDVYFCMYVPNWRNAAFLETPMCGMGVLNFETSSFWNQQENIKKQQENNLRAQSWKVERSKTWGLQLQPTCFWSFNFSNLDQLELVPVM